MKFTNAKTMLKDMQQYNLLSYSISKDHSSGNKRTLVTTVCLNSTEAKIPTWDKKSIIFENHIKGTFTGKVIISDFKSCNKEIVSPLEANYYITCEGMQEPIMMQGIQTNN